MMPSSMQCMSSLRVILWGFWLPVGCLDRASGVLFLMPGMCVILKRYGRVLSLRFLSLVLQMWCRDLSLKIFRSGYDPRQLLGSSNLGRSVVLCLKHLPLLMLHLQSAHIWIRRHV